MLVQGSVGGIRARGAAPPLGAPVARAGSGLRIQLDPVRIALSALIILNVSRLHQHFGFLAVLRPAMLLTLVAVGYAFLQPKAFSVNRGLRTTPAKLIILIGALAVISAPFGLSLGGSGRYLLESYSKVIVAAIILVMAIRHAGDLYVFMWAYVIGCGILAFFALFVFQTEVGVIDQVARLSDLHTFDANDICVVLLVGVGLGLLLLKTAGPMGKVTLAFLLLGIAAAIARSGSRGGFVGLVATAAAVLFLSEGISVPKRIVTLVVVLFGVSLAAPVGYWERMQGLLQPKQDYNWTATDGRKQVFQRGMGYMLAYPVFGLGINNFWRAECLEESFAKVRNRDLDRGIRCTAPHNTYVQAAAELGVPGLTVFGLIVIGGIVRMLRFRKRIPSGWSTGDRERRFLAAAPSYLAIAMIGFAVSCFFVSFAWIDIVYILTALMAGFEAICRQSATATRPQAVRQPQSSRVGRRSPPLRSPARSR